MNQLYVVAREILADILRSRNFFSLSSLHAATEQPQNITRKVDLVVTNQPIQKKVEAAVPAEVAAQLVVALATENSGHGVGGGGLRIRVHIHARIHYIRNSHEITH